MKFTRWFTTFVILGLAAVTALPSMAAVASTGSNPLSALGLKASDFGGPINNPYLPLIPGTTYYYAGLASGVPNTDYFQVTRRTKAILGVTTTVILDRGYSNGVIEESTVDYFAQDRNGAVWYFGEFATQFTNGSPSGHAGSWISGANGALPGIAMEAHPKLGDVYNQENAAPIAEDAGKVISLTASVSVPFGTFNGHVLETKDFSYLDTEVENKYYVRGVGNVRSETRGSISTDYAKLLMVLTS